MNVLLTSGTAFAGVVTAAAAWSIWGQDMFPKEADPTGGRLSIILSEVVHDTKL